MKYLYLPLSFFALTLNSCNQEKELKLQKGTVINQTVQETSNNTSMLQNLPSNEIAANPIFTTNQNPTTNNSDVALNPEHGQPGHRCEIPVGAPLNSSPAPTNNASNNNPIQINPTSSPQAPASTPINLSKTGSAGLNPEHGQPGHKCEIPVGAPLNSTPENNQRTIPATKEVSSPLKENANPLKIQPATPPSANPAPKVSPLNPNAKLNPEHGQPGHRCDVEVGDPLPE